MPAELRGSTGYVGSHARTTCLTPSRSHSSSQRGRSSLLGAHEMTNFIPRLSTMLKLSGLSPLGLGEPEDDDCDDDDLRALIVVCGVVVVVVVWGGV